MNLPADWRQDVERAVAADRPAASGRVAAVQATSIAVFGLRASVGDLCTVASARGSVPGEVVAFTGGTTVLAPLGEPDGVALGDRVVKSTGGLTVPTGDALLGRVIDPLGRPIDGGAPLRCARRRPVRQQAPDAFRRTPIRSVFATGVPAVDAFTTLGRGQRLGVFAGAGVGKSHLLGAIARSSSADRNVIALIGERGREVREFVDDVLGPEGLARSVVVVATSDAAAGLRRLGAFTAVTIAEAFRAEGRDVMFAMDSVTRFAAAVRELGLAAGEPPAVRGHPPSLHAELPRLLERLGNDARGTLTGVLTVLVEGDDHDEPVADAVRGLLDGHLVLDRGIAALGRYPAIDIARSLSRVMDRIVDAEHLQAARRVRAWLARLDDSRDLVAVGAYRRGSDPALDVALDAAPAIERFLGAAAGVPFDETRAGLIALGRSS